jgi:hypothetical protein
MKTFNLEITPPWGPEVVPPDLFSTPFLRGILEKDASALREVESFHTFLV